MIDQANSNLNKHKNTFAKFKKLKPLHFLLIFVGISMLIAFILGGYLIGKNNNQKEKQEAAVTLEEQVELNPVELPGNPDNWTVYKLEPLNMQFKLPEELNKKGNWKVNEIDGTTGKTICFSDKNINTDSECEGKALIIVATSSNFTSDRPETFLNSQGFEIENGIYTVNSLTGEKLNFTDTKFKSYENNENFEILKIVGKENGLTATPEVGYLGAIVNTNNSEYPAIILQMNINSDISEYEFDQILESLQIAN